MRVDYDPPPFIQMTVVPSTAASTAAAASTTASTTASTSASTSAAQDAPLLLRTDPEFTDPLSFWKVYHSNPLNEFVQGPQWWRRNGSATTPGDSNAYALLSSSFGSFNAATQLTRVSNDTFRYTGPGPESTAAAVGDKVRLSEASDGGGAEQCEEERRGAVRRIE